VKKIKKNQSELSKMCLCYVARITLSMIVKFPLGLESIQLRINSLLSFVTSDSHRKSIIFLVRSTHSDTIKDRPKQNHPFRREKDCLRFKRSQGNSVKYILQTPHLPFHSPFLKGESPFSKGK
jgi:hypothetical protein